MAPPGSPMASGPQQADALALPPFPAPPPPQQRRSLHPLAIIVINAAGVLLLCLALIRVADSIGGSAPARPQVPVPGPASGYPGPP